MPPGTASIGASAGSSFIFSAVMTWYLGGRTARDRLALALVTWSLFLSHAAGSIIAWVYFFFAPILFSTVITVLLGIGCVRDWLAGRGTGADHNCEVGGSNPPSCPSEVINRNARLIRIVVQAPEGQRRYSPAECIGAVKHRVEANPDPKHVSTSFAERQNLSMRMGNRCMTRLTNAFSKKTANHAHMMAIYFMHYNFVRIHQTLKVTPVMAAGVTDKLWETSDVVKVLED